MGKAGYYYGARYYNPRVSLWLNVDPLAEKYPSWSPYNYTLNNPLKHIDQDGNEPEDIIITGSDKKSLENFSTRKG
ncbi:RHS repeat-associated core domain-containing protein [uncultured Chryseobacterium sp.]|uniref:RHS repeat-associated core domain-containing protein n=1 Tax=uncultured Chryseobacterium sp. TaxID=259322 RepID=UPI00258DAEE6|nr:RHS repeat-associated core domain-containing protein [uncultured Chryseobacterium sp.]